VLVPLRGENSEIGFRMPPGTVVVRGRSRQKVGDQVHAARLRHSSRWVVGPTVRLRRARPAGQGKAGAVTCHCNCQLLNRGVACRSTVVTARVWQDCRHRHIFSDNAGTIFQSDELTDRSNSSMSMLPPSI
jgi:hypothetical protein